MGAPQILVIVLLSIGLYRSASQHGQPDTPINFWATLIGAAIMGSLLYWGGFFG